MRQWSLSRPTLLSKTERMGYTIEDVPFGYLNARVRWTGGEGAWDGVVKKLSNKQPA